MRLCGGKASGRLQGRSQEARSPKDELCSCGVLLCQRSSIVFSSTVITFWTRYVVLFVVSTVLFVGYITQWYGQNMTPEQMLCDPAAAATSADFRVTIVCVAVFTS